MLNRKPSQRASSARRQRGFTMTESIVSVLVFALGILGLVGMQASAVRVSQDARYRIEAALLADELVARMLASPRTSVATTFATGGAAFDDWLTNRVRSPGRGLPAGDATVAFNALPGEPLSVRIAITWVPPRESVRDVAGSTIVESRGRQHVTVTALYD